MTKPGCTQTGKRVKFRCDWEKKRKTNKNRKNKPPGKTKPTNQQNQGEELKASTATPPPGKPHGTAWTRMQGGVNPKRSGIGQTLIYILYIGIYIYIYHLEGHAEKTRDRSGIYRKKELRSFQSHTKKEAHSRTKWGTKGDTGVLGWPFTMTGFGWGMVSGPRALIHPLGGPGPLCPSVGSRDGV